MEAGRPRISSEDAVCRLNIEIDRLLCDDGLMLPWWPTARKAQRDRRVQDWAGNGQHAGSRMRQEGRGGAYNCSWPQAGRLEGQDFDFIR